MQASAVDAQRQTPMDDLDTFLEANFQDLQSFDWGGPLAASNSPIQHLSVSPQIDLAQQQYNPATLSNDDLLMSQWMNQQATASQVSPQTSQSVERSYPVSHDFGSSFDIPDINHSLTVTPEASMQRARSAGNPLLSSDLQSTAPLEFPLASADSGDLRVTFKDKQNTPPPDQGNKTLSLAERNKQAQRRHRQRQKDRMGTLEGQVKQLTEEKQQLAAEKATLAGQNAILNQVLQMREEQLRNFKDGELQTHQPLHGHAAPSQARPQTSPFIQPEVQEGVAESSQREGAVSAGLAQSLATTLTLTVREDQPIKLSPAQVKALAPEDVSKMWAEYLSAMMRELELPENASGITHASDRRIKLLLQEVLVLLMRYALGDLHKMKTFVVHHNQAQSPISYEKKERWRAAASSMRLTIQQRNAITQLRRLFLKKQGMLVCERLKAVATLQQSIPNPISSHDIAIQFLKTQRAVGNLQTILHRENQLIVDLVYTFLLKVVTPVQAARCLVQTFPSYPDTLCIFTWIAAEDGEADAIALLDMPKQELFTSSPSHSNDPSY